MAVTLLAGKPAQYTTPPPDPHAEPPPEVPPPDANEKKTPPVPPTPDNPKVPPEPKVPVEPDASPEFPPPLYKPEPDVPETKTPPKSSSTFHEYRDRLLTVKYRYLISLMDPSDLSRPTVNFKMQGIRPASSVKSNHIRAATCLAESMLRSRGYRVARAVKVDENWLSVGSGSGDEWFTFNPSGMDRDYEYYMAGIEYRSDFKDGKGKYDSASHDADSLMDSNEAKGELPYSDDERAVYRTEYRKQALNRVIKSDARMKAIVTPALGPEALGALSPCRFRYKASQTQGTCWAASILNVLVHSPCMYMQLVKLNNRPEKSQLAQSILEELEDGDVKYSVKVLQLLVDIANDVLDARNIQKAARNREVTAMFARLTSKSAGAEDILLELRSYKGIDNLERAMLLRAIAELLRDAGSAKQVDKAIEKFNSAPEDTPLIRYDLHTGVSAAHMLEILRVAWGHLGAAVEAFDFSVQKVSPSSVSVTTPAPDVVYIKFSKTSRLQNSLPNVAGYVIDHIIIDMPNHVVSGFMTDINCTDTGDRRSGPKMKFIINSNLGCDDLQEFDWVKMVSEPVGAARDAMVKAFDGVVKMMGDKYELQGYVVGFIRKEFEAECDAEYRTHCAA